MPRPPQRAFSYANFAAPGTAGFLELANCAPLSAADVEIPPGGSGQCRRPVHRDQAADFAVDYIGEIQAHKHKPLSLMNLCLVLRRLRQGPSGLE